MEFLPYCGFACFMIYFIAERQFNCLQRKQKRISITERVENAEKQKKFHID